MARLKPTGPVTSDELKNAILRTIAKRFSDRVLTPETLQLALKQVKFEGKLAAPSASSEPVAGRRPRSPKPQAVRYVAGVTSAATDQERTRLSAEEARWIVLKSKGLPTQDWNFPLKERIEELLTKPSVRLTEQNTWLDLAAAALARANLEIESAELRAFGFVDGREVASSRFPTLEALSDFNLDRALDLLVDTNCQQHSDATPSREELESRFIADGKIQLLIATHQRNPHFIGNRGNVGDNFGLHITKHLSSRDVLPFGVWAEHDQPAMLTVGSIIKNVGSRGLVWGSGSIDKLRVRRAPWSTRSIFLGVRGPRTREQVLLRYAINPRVIGDPGVLITEVCSPEARVLPDIECGFVLHSVDKPFFLEKWPDAFLIDNHTTPQALANDVLRCKHVVSSSLHGTIFAQALGVPCVAVKFGDRLRGDEFKFVDYFQSTGIYSFTERMDLSEFPALAIPDFVELVRQAPQPSLDALKSALLETFPF